MSASTTPPAWPTARDAPGRPPRSALGARRAARRAQDQRGAVLGTRGLIRWLTGDGRAHHDRPRLGVPQAIPGAAPAAASRCATAVPGRARRGPSSGPSPRTRPSASFRPACANGPMRAPLRPRRSARQRSIPGATTATPPGPLPPSATIRRPAACAHRRSLVRPTAPFLRPDLPASTTGPLGRRQARRRRPAPADAKRPCADPPDR